MTCSNPTFPSPAKQGRDGAPLEKGGCLFQGNPGRGWAMLLMNRNSGFSIDCCPHPTPSLLLRKQYLSLREQCLSQRERGLSTEMQTRPRGCLHFVLNAVATRFLHPLPAPPPLRASPCGGGGCLNCQHALTVSAFIWICGSVAWVNEARAYPNKNTSFGAVRPGNPARDICE